MLPREDGGEVLWQFYNPGDFLGEMNISEITERPYTIQTVEKSKKAKIDLKLMETI